MDRPRSIGSSVEEEQDRQHMLRRSEVPFAAHVIVARRAPSPSSLRLRLTAARRWAYLLEAAAQSALRAANANECTSAPAIQAFGGHHHDRHQYGYHHREHLRRYREKRLSYLRHECQGDNSSA